MEDRVEYSGTLAYLAAITIANSVFFSYLASSENLFDTVFGLGDWYPIIFGVMAVQVTTINANTAAMIPLDHVAGSGAALLSFATIRVAAQVSRRSLADHLVAVAI